MLPSEDRGLKTPATFLIDPFYLALLSARKSSYDLAVLCLARYLILFSFFANLDTPLIPVVFASVSPLRNGFLR